MPEITKEDVEAIEKEIREAFDQTDVLERAFKESQERLKMLRDAYSKAQFRLQQKPARDFLVSPDPVALGKLTDIGFWSIKNREKLTQYIESFPGIASLVAYHSSSKDLPLWAISLNKDRSPKAQRGLLGLLPGLPEEGQIRIMEKKGVSRFRLMYSGGAISPQRIALIHRLGAGAIRLFDHWREALDFVHDQFAFSKPIIKTLTSVPPSNTVKQ